MNHFPPGSPSADNSVVISGLRLRCSRKSWNIDFIDRVSLFASKNIHSKDWLLYARNIAEIFFYVRKSIIQSAHIVAKNISQWKIPYLLTEVILTHHRLQKVPTVYNTSYKHELQVFFYCFPFNKLLFNSFLLLIEGSYCYQLTLPGLVQVYLLYSLVRSSNLTCP